MEYRVATSTSATISSSVFSNNQANISITVSSILPPVPDCATCCALLTCAGIELSLRGIPANAAILLITFRSTSSLLYARIRLNKAPKLRPPGTCVDPRCLCRMHCEEEARRCYTPAFKQFQYIRGDTSGDDTCLNFNPLFPPGRAGRSLRFEPFCLDRFLASFLAG